MTYLFRHCTQKAKVFQVPQFERRPSEGHYEILLQMRDSDHVDRGFLGPVRSKGDGLARTNVSVIQFIADEIGRGPTQRLVSMAEDGEERSPL